MPKGKTIKEPTEKQLAARAKFAENARIRSEEAKARKLAKEPAGVNEASHEPVPRVMKVPDGVQVPKKEVPLEKPSEGDAPEPVAPENSNLLDIVVRMQQQINELLAANPGTGRERVDQVAQMNGAHVGSQGVQGRVYIYPIEPNHYPDPTDRLYDEPKLRKFAMRENFYIKWEVSGTTYEKYGVTYTEPRFMVELWRFIFDEDTGEPSGEMFLVNRHMQHEDELIARLSADKLGLELGEGKDFQTLEDLMHEMRYHRIQQWLLAVFRPFRANQYKARKIKQRVIGGRVVEVTDTEELTDSASGIASANTVEREIELTPAERREAERTGLL